MHNMPKSDAGIGVVGGVKFEFARVFALFFSQMFFAYIRKRKQRLHDMTYDVAPAPIVIGHVFCCVKHICAYVCMKN